MAPENKRIIIEEREGTPEELRKILDIIAPVSPEESSGEQDAPKVSKGERFAADCKECFDALLSKGFTEEQAMRLVVAVMT